MKKNVFLVAMLGMMLALGMVVVGCDDGDNGNNNSDGGKTEAEAMGDVSDATTADAMKTALEEGASALGIDLTSYNTLTAGQKTAVANAVLAGKPYANAAAIKAAFDAAVTVQAPFEGSWSGHFTNGVGDVSVLTFSGNAITIVTNDVNDRKGTFTYTGNQLSITFTHVWSGSEWTSGSATLDRPYTIVGSTLTLLDPDEIDPPTVLTKQ